MLAGDACVRVDPTGVLEIVRGGVSVLRRPLTSEARWPTPVIGCASAAGTTALVGLARHDLLLLVSALAETPSGSRGHAPLRRIDLGPRLAGSEEMALDRAGPGFVVVLECGVIVLDERGTERWRLDRVTVGWRVVTERDGALWLEDREGNLVGFDVETGLERL